MQIKIERLSTNPLYTSGRIYMNGKRGELTIEATEGMLPEGRYRMLLVKDEVGKRHLTIESCHPNGSKGRRWTFGIGHSWITSARHRHILFGDALIPGALLHSAVCYERLVKRIEKCEKRMEEVTLVISESFVLEKPIAKFWL